MGKTRIRDGLHGTQRNKRNVNQLRNSSNHTVCTLKWMRTVGYVVFLEKQKNKYNFLIGKQYTTGFSEQQLKR
jgi:hypothetical protein